MGLFEDLKSTRDYYLSEIKIVHDFIKKIDESFTRKQGFNPIEFPKKVREELLQLPTLLREAEKKEQKSINPRNF